MRWGQRVDNHGRGGYGSDQAFLRFRRDLAEGAEVAPVVLLVHLSENVLRNLNQFRGLLYGGGDGLGFKPRFVLDPAGRLQLVPLPTPSAGDYPALIARPSAFLTAETFLPESPEGPRYAAFPHLPEVALAFGHPRVLSFLRGEPQYLRFYAPTHPAGGTALTAALLEAFWQEAAARGRRGLPVLMPTGLDLVYARKHGHLPYQPLADALRRRGVPFLDLGPPLAEAIGSRAIADYYSDADPGRHPNAAGYALIADVVARQLEPLSDIDSASGGSFSPTVSQNSAEL